FSFPPHTDSLRPSEFCSSIAHPLQGSTCTSAGTQDPVAAALDSNIAPTRASKYIPRHTRSIIPSTRGIRRTGQETSYRHQPQPPNTHTSASTLLHAGLLPQDRDPWNLRARLVASTNRKMMMASLTGSWALDVHRSDTLEAYLRCMGAPGGV
ncbi:unnamed protein product, partial [Ectocarpus fasciculatus]